MWAEIAFLATLVFYLTLKPIILFSVMLTLNFFFNFKECFFALLSTNILPNLG